jgi:hypothetical protein
VVSLYRCGLWRLGSWCWCRAGVTHPDEDAVILINRQAFGIDEFVLEGFKVSFRQSKAALQSTIGESLLALQKRLHLCQNIVKGHGSLSIGAGHAMLHLYRVSLMEPGGRVSAQGRSVKQGATFSELITSSVLLDYIGDFDLNYVRIESPSC